MNGNLYERVVSSIDHKIHRMEEKSMFCPKCGKQIPEGAKFCGGCGNPVQMGIGVSSGSRPDSAKPPKQMKPPKPPKPPKAPKPPKQEKPQKQNAKQVQQMPTAPQNVQSVQGLNQTPASNLPSNMVMTRDTRDEERKNRKMTIILCIVLAVLILVAAGMGIYYFKVLKNSDGAEPDRIEESGSAEETEQTGEDVQAGEETQSTQQDAEQSETAQEEGVISDTNEVVGDTILENIPKSVYSYSFNETLGNAKVAVRNAPDTEPEETDDIEPQYVRGIDDKAVYLDGTYGIRLSDVESVGDSYTIAFWMKADELHDWSPFIHIGRDLYDSNKRVRLWLGQKTDGASIAPIISSERAQTEDSFEIRPGQSMPNTIEPGVWYHIAFTVDGSKQGSKQGRLLGTLYVAGKYVGEGDVVPNTMNADDFDVYLGINCWDQLYPVAFDEVKIWNQVLDEDQIQELYSAYE